MKIFSDYFKIILFGLTATVLLRSIETLLILTQFDAQESFFGSELLGLTLDIGALCICLLVAFPCYYLLHKASAKLSYILIVSLISLFFIANFFIIEYFAYQLLPLDVFLYKHTFKEVQFTVATSSVNHFIVFAILIFLFILLFVSLHYIHKKEYSKKIIITGYTLSLICAISFASVHAFDILEYNLFSLNKPRYFYTQSLSYFLQEEDTGITKSDVYAFHKLHPSNSYLDINYPLMHTFKDDNVLEPFFEKFDSAPNIVILIVEGLNDDYIHPYRGVDLMPYVSQLKDKSLYWNKCFTLGERSFAVVPSLTGSLPYGETGFMQSDIIPHHLSLVPILKANQYHTTFFYSQAQWFHNKGKYFELNNIDLIIDNTKFNPTYKKIIVGADHFFWGYNDKDLFHQSLEVIDHLPIQKRLDIYFTGTSHPPFTIADTLRYENKFSELTKLLKTKEDISFFQTHKKYILSELFVNDALEEFMSQYKNRKEYQNTIFIITGDHPMTELPRANELKKYHVPLIIYSPHLKSPKVFTQIASHLDVYESLLSFLAPYKIKIPTVSTAIGGKINTTAQYREEKVAFMNGNREVLDYLSGNYFLSNQQLYKVNDDLSLTKSTDKIREAKLKNELHTFNKVTQYAYKTNSIIPDSLYCQSLAYPLINSQRLDSLVFAEEHHTLIETSIPNRASCLDISLTTPKKNMEGFDIICEFRSKSGATLFWQNYGMTTDHKKYQLHLNFPKQSTTDSDLTFKAFVYNAKKQKVKLDDIRVLMYQK